MKRGFKVRWLTWRAICASPWVRELRDARGGAAAAASDAAAARLDAEEARRTAAAPAAAAPWTELYKSISQPNVSQGGGGGGHRESELIAAVSAANRRRMAAEDAAEEFEIEAENLRVGPARYCSPHHVTKRILNPSF